jgi:hypothetical protein
MIKSCPESSTSLKRYVLDKYPLRFALTLLLMHFVAEVYYNRSMYLGQYSRASGDKSALFHAAHLIRANRAQSTLVRLKPGIVQCQSIK